MAKESLITLSIIVGILLLIILVYVTINNYNEDIHNTVDFPEQSKHPNLDAECDETEHETITLPVRVYLYEFEAEPEFSAQSTKNKVIADFERVNEIWNQAGIEYKINFIEKKKITSSQVRDFKNLDRQSLKKVLFRIAPEYTTGIWNVVYLRKMPVPAGGFYAAPEQTVYYNELNPQDEHHPEILAHELGHSLLGSEHSLNERNIMNTDNPEEATKLTKEQIHNAREQASKGPMSAQDYK